jgi:hypothetical protein
MEPAMTVAEGSLTRFAAITEATFGTTPATPTFLIARNVSTQPHINYPHAESQERQASGRLNQTYATLASGELSGEIEWADDDVLDLWLQSAMRGAWATDVLKDGTTKNGLTIEQTYEQGATDTFYRLTGFMVNTLSVSITPGQAVRSSFSGMALDGDVDTAIIAGATYTAAGTEQVMSGCDVTAISAYGLSSPQFLGMRVNINSNARLVHKLGSRTAFQQGLGRFRVTVELDVYLENAAAITAALANTAGAISCTFGPTTNKRYKFDAANARILDHRPANSTNDMDEYVTLICGCMHDVSDASAFKITRNVA